MIIDSLVEFLLIVLSIFSKFDKGGQTSGAPWVLLALIISKSAKSLYPSIRKKAQPIAFVFVSPTKMPIFGRLC